MYQDVMVKGEKTADMVFTSGTKALEILSAEAGNAGFCSFQPY